MCATTCLNRPKLWFRWQFVIFNLLLFLLMGCTSPEPIRLAYVAELSGVRSDLGVNGRNGAQLAVDQINEAGGIDGRPLELIIENNQGDLALTREIDARLIDEGVSAIIGHMTSSETAATLDLFNQSGSILISPTSSSDQFSGQADHFFRVMPSTSIHGRALAQHIINTRGITQIVGVYDLDNRSFAETLWHAIQTEFETQGGDAQIEFPMNSTTSNLQTLAAEITAVQPEAIVFITSDVDTALLAQYIRQLDPDVSFFSSGWAFTNALPAKGGSAVEGLEINALFNLENSNPTFQTFVQQYTDRFNAPPGFSAVYTYEAVLLFAKAMEVAESENIPLAEAMTILPPLDGIQGPIILDAYGDVARDVYIAVINDGQAQIIQTIPVSK